MIKDSLSKLKQNIAKVVVGYEDIIDLLMVGFLANGHILIEDVPGLGKTLLAKVTAVSLDLRFKRVQFTPDLTPTDVTGFYVFDRRTNEFVFREGPVSANILLADEINRAVPRTQSSLLEAMEERQVTVDGQTIVLPKPFIVLATQNPIDMEGTFPLPEAQLDRFLVKIKMGYPSFAQEMEILDAHGQNDPLKDLKPVISIGEILDWQQLRGQVKNHPSISEYIVELVRKTRSHEAVSLGASPRASLALFKAAQALAMVRGRDYVIPDDIKRLVKPVLAHRLVLKRDYRLKGITEDHVLEELMMDVPIPLEEGEKSLEQ
ncbi:MAG: AAA family ATPase [Peptococcaceae bacterium]